MSQFEEKKDYDKKCVSKNDEIKKNYNRKKSVNVDDFLLWKWVGTLTNLLSSLKNIKQ